MILYIFTRRAGWFRIFGYGLWYTNQTPLFSERYGYKRKLFGAFGYRVFFLSRGK